MKHLLWEIQVICLMEVKHSDGMVSSNKNIDSFVVNDYRYLVSYREMEKGELTLTIIVLFRTCFAYDLYNPNCLGNERQYCYL